MKKKPLLFTIVPLILIGICASLYFQTAYVLNTSLTNYSKIISKLTVSNWVTMGSTIVAGILIMKSHKWSKYFMPLTIIVVFWNNYLVATQTNNFTKTQIALAAILFALLFAPLYTKRMHAILTDRNLQWWKNPFRRRNKILVGLKTQNGQQLETYSHDVSKSGLFLCFDNEPWDNLPKIGEKVELHLNFSEKNKLECQALVVRLVEPVGYYPRGMGLKLDTLPPRDQKLLETYVSNPNKV